ncbi:MAG: amidohydrolase [Kordiimonadaceae bacterium]|nr:amidohydrolase [Kordiimonadaceae bacterium]
MRMEDMILVSVDDHIVEPPNLFTHHVPEKFKARAPKIITAANGAEHWSFEGTTLRNIGLNAVAGRVKEEFGWEPTAYKQMRKGTYDVDARVDDMNVNGVLGSLNFPSFPGYCGRLWLDTEDKELALVMLKAYNDWHIDEWCGKHPGRFIPLALLPLWDVSLMVEEMHRVSKKGVHAVSFTENPTKYGLPSFHTDHWDPFWKACCDLEMVVAIHIGSGGGMSFPSADSPIDVAIATMPMTLLDCASDLLFSPVLRKFDGLKIALSEGGIGWIPYFLERADYTFKQHSPWTHQKFPGKLPSEVFQDHIITCFIDDVTGLKNRHDVGIDTITWECDYPHSDSQWPNAPEKLWESIQTLPDNEIDKITHGNAMRDFKLNSFDILGRENCTVEALRAKATHVDTTPISFGEGAAPNEDGEARLITATDIKRITGAAL